MSKLVTVHGKCNKKFHRVQEAFLQNFLNQEEIGAGITVIHNGKIVVDLYAGVKNSSNQEPWTHDTVVPLFSVTKGLTAFCFLTLAAQKKLDYDAPVVKYWKDFGRNGKDQITVRQMLEHRAGLHRLDVKLHVSDFWKQPEKVYQALVEQRPTWEPGSKQAYGAQVWGAYASELFRQITNESAGSFFNREVSLKNNLNVFMGLPSDKRGQVATVYPVSTWERVTSLIPHFLKGDDSEGRTVRAILKGNSETQKAYLNPWIGSKGLEAFNEPAIQMNELLWANAIANSHGIAVVYQSILEGKLGPSMRRKLKVSNTKLIQDLTRPNPMEFDEVIHKNLGWNLGFMKEEPGIFSPNTEAFGHPGMGGSLGFADPKAKLVVGYVCNKMNYRNRPEKTMNLCRSIYESL
ncbi:MAG: beta-lactamase family protein [Leptospira sp.]|nr:beta-lactamase family protein [Leptospira sp.]